MTRGTSGAVALNSPRHLYAAGNGAIKLGYAVTTACALVSTSSLADLTGNVAAVSEYMFRGIALSDGSAVQAGVDYVHAGGLYAGFWTTNTGFVGPSGVRATYETDIYGGYAAEFGRFRVDAGALYYDYRDDTLLNTVEYTLGGGWGPLTLKAYYTPDYYGAGASSTYLAAELSWPLSETLTASTSVGRTSGEGVKRSLGDEYTDYGVALNKTLQDGYSFNLAVLGTDLDTAIVPEDRPKFVVGLKLDFDL